MQWWYCKEGRTDVVPVIRLFIHLDKMPENILDIRVWVLCFTGKCPDYHTFQNAFSFCPDSVELCYVVWSSLKEAWMLNTSRLRFLFVDFEEATRRCYLQPLKLKKEIALVSYFLHHHLGIFSSVYCKEESPSPSLRRLTVAFCPARRTLCCGPRLYAYICVYVCVCMYIFENFYECIFLQSCLSSLEGQGFRPSVVLSVS